MHEHSRRIVLSFSQLFDAGTLLTAKVAVVGATTWGTTLSVIMASEGREVTLLARNSDERDRLAAGRENARFLPGVTFPELLAVSSDPAEALAGAGMVVIAVPSDRLRENARRIAGHLGPDTVVVSATKGLELPSALRMSEVLAEELPAPVQPSICSLSGPNLAKEISQGKPSTTVVASESREAAERAQAALLSSRFRVYTSDDVAGVELGGALKNIVALGAGICDGLEFGENAKAALITRGLAEIARLGGGRRGAAAYLCRAGRCWRRHRHMRQPPQPQPLRGGTVGPGPLLAGNPRLNGQCGRGVSTLLARRSRWPGSLASKCP